MTKPWTFSTCSTLKVWTGTSSGKGGKVSWSRLLYWPVSFSVSADCRICPNPVFWKYLLTELLGVPRAEVDLYPKAPSLPPWGRCFGPCAHLQTIPFPVILTPKINESLWFKSTCTGGKIKFSSQAAKNGSVAWHAGKSTGLGTKRLWSRQWAAASLSSVVEMELRPGGC